MLKSAAVVVLLLSVARASLDDAISLYERAKLTEARSALESIIEDSGTTPADLEQARLYLAATLLAARDRPRAKDQLRAVMKDKPASFAIDPVVFPADLLALAYEVRVELDQAKTKVEPAPASAPTPTADPEPAPAAATEVVAKPSRSPLGIAGMALGVVSGVLGGVFLSLANDNHNQLMSMDKVMTITNGEQLARDGSTFQTGGWALIGVGTALLVAGIVMLLVM